MKQPTENDLRQALEKKDKNVLIDFVCQYKWERDYFQVEYKKFSKQNKVLEKTLDIALFHIVDNIKGLKTLEEKREKKAQLKHIFMEVAEYILKDKGELC